MGGFQLRDARINGSLDVEASVRLVMELRESPIDDKLGLQWGNSNE